MTPDLREQSVAALDAGHGRPDRAIGNSDGPIAAALRAGICGFIAFSILAFGSVEVWSSSLLTIGAGVLLAMWAVSCLTARESDVVLNPLLVPLLGLCLLALLQIGLSLSLYSFATRTELLRLATYTVFAFLATQVFRTPRHLSTLFWFLLVLGFLVAMFGITQHLTSPRTLYWFHKVADDRSPFGPYANHSHFAGLMELIIPLGLGMVFLRGTSSDKLPLAGLLTLVPIGALFLSASRAGALIFPFQVILLGFLLLRRQAGRKTLAAGLAFALLGGFLVSWLGTEYLRFRFSEASPGELTGGRRLSLIVDSYRIFRDHPWFGSGLGTFETVQPRYESFYDGKLAVHAHNEYAELLAETGATGGLCGLAFLVLLYKALVSRLNRDRDPLVTAFRHGALLSCSGLLAHGWVDFNLRIPANALLFFLLATVAAGVKETR